MRKILVTGAVGFIGFHLTRRLLEWGEAVVGLDNLNPYYDVTLKEARFALPEKHGNFSFVRADLADRRAMEAVFDKKLQKLIVRTVENILTALIEVCAESYGNALRKATGLLDLTQHEQNDLAGLALQRNRPVHRYLNFCWQTIRALQNE